MPFKKSRFRKPRFRGRSSFRTRVKKIVNSTRETKCFGSPLATDFSSVNNTWTDVDIGGKIVEGDAFNQRDGRVVNLKYFTFNGVLAAEDIFNIFRIVVVIADKDGFTTGGGNINSDWNPCTENGCKVILYDKYFYLNNNTGDSNMNRQVIKFALNLKNMKVGYNGGTINMTKGDSIRVLMISDSSLIAHPGFLTGYYRLTYKDT